MLFIVSLLMTAAGAILRYAADSTLWTHVNEDTVGAILLVLGVMGIIYSWLALMIAAAITAVAKGSINKVAPTRVRGRRI